MRVSMAIRLVRWKIAKDKGERLFKGIHGGSYDVFNERPVSKDIVAYCVGDVVYLPVLREKYWTRQTVQWRDVVSDETKKRVAMSMELDYRPHDPDKAKVPWSEAQNGMLDQWNYVPCLLEDCFSEWMHGDGGYGEDDWVDDDGPTSCRDIISDRDYDMYYSD
jgi:exonuclease 3'-5' domain-containing protein 1